MKSFKCKECDAEFPSRRSLHAHIKVHGLKIGEYYRKHFPRFDLYTHKPIDFKNVDQYLTSDFNRPSNLSKWIGREPKSVTRPYLVELMRKKVEEKGNLVLGEVQLMSYGLPSIAFLEKNIGSYKDFAKEVGYPMQFPETMPSKYHDNCMGFKILVDTREKKPLDFKYTESFKLDFGDYTLPARQFTYTFVDRKDVGDFVSTLGLDFERVDNEIERCRQAGCYLYFVVEGTMKRIEQYITFNKWNLSSTYAHVMHNMRELLRKHAGHCQFIFTQGRQQSEYIIPKLLHCGKKAWNVDIQHYLEMEGE